MGIIMEHAWHISKCPRPKIFVEMSSAVVVDTKSVSSIYKQQRGAGNNKLQIKHKHEHEHKFKYKQDARNVAGIKVMRFTCCQLTKLRPSLRTTIENVRSSYISIYTYVYIYM